MSTATAPTGYDVAMPITNNIIGIPELAEILGIGIQSARAYNTRAALHRKEAADNNDPSRIRPGDLPVPDGRFGNSPYWEEATIKKWLEQRPGRGGHNKDKAKANVRKKAPKPRASA